MSVARSIHQDSAAAHDALHSAASSAFEVLQPTPDLSEVHEPSARQPFGLGAGPYVPSSTPPRLSGRKRHCAQHLETLATNPGEYFGLAVLIALAFVSSAAAGSGGVVVEEVAATGAVARVGVAEGDLLLSWRREPRPPANPEVATGRFISPFNLQQVEAEQAPRGPLVLYGERAGKAFSVNHPGGPLQVTARPMMDETDLGAYRVAIAASENGDIEAAVAGLEALAESSADRGDVWTSVWLLMRAVEVLKTTETRERADRLCEKAIAAAEHAGDPSLQAWLLHIGAEGLRHRGETKNARRYHQRALEIRQQSAPESLVVALSFHQLGVLAYIAGDPVSADRMWRSGMEIRERLAPDSLALASSLNNLALNASITGELDQAEGLHGRSLVIREQLAPNSLEVAQSLTNLGVAAFVRGDIAAHEQYQRRALDIIEVLAPNSLDVATSVFNLGGVAFDRGDFVLAEHHFLRALEIRKRLQPESLAVAGVLNALAMVALRRDDLEAAQAFNQQALELRNKLAPDGRDVADSLITQGFLAIETNRLGVAESSLRRAASILDKVAPGSLEMGTCLSDLGRVVFRRGDAVEAEALQRRALAVIQAVAPNGISEAQVLHELGLVLRTQGKREQALELMMRAIDGLEAQVERLGGATERRAGFREIHMDIYRNALALQVEAGRVEQAFAILERSRAHAQLAMLAERDLMFSADIPVDLERRRRKVAAESDRVLAELWSLRALDPGAREPAQRAVGGLVPSEGANRSAELFDRLRELRREQEEIRVLIRDTSPRLAALTYPQPLGFGETASMLDHGTVLLAYSVGDEASYLFVVEADAASMKVFRLGGDEDLLRSQITRFRDLVRVGEQSSGELDLLTRDLSLSLLAPASKSIARASRLVIVADGPLHLLPFAALSDPLSGGLGRYLVERLPLTVVASATVLAELKQRRRERSLERVVAFGDPLVAVEPNGAGLPQLGWSGATIGPLPGSRAEVEGLVPIFGEATTIWVGENATEERVKSVETRTTILHMAVHGVVSEELPMESALVLATPGRAGLATDNGLLQVWEIFEQVRLDADLVTLSACDTALGREISGEGLLGLSQAFLYAGARAVVASLWSVADLSTAELMQRFYINLRAGLPKDQALRAAQLELIRAPVKRSAGDGSTLELHARHPFYWAGFQLYGDWQ